MSQAWLSYDKAPPLWLPAGFFGAALAWLALLGGVPLLSPAPAANRYLPEVLAMTHMLALGVLGNVMIGALLQLIAVASGVPTPHPGRLLVGIGAGWQLGTALLVGAFLSGMTPWALQAAGACLSAAVLGLMLHALGGLLRSPARDATSLGMRRALFGLAGAAVLGGALTLGFSGWLALPLDVVLDSHVLWAGTAWLAGLILAVSQTVIPMFLVTPPYPRAMRALGASLLPLVGLATLAHALDVARGVADLLLGTVLCAYALITLWLLRQSRRPDDPARRQWQRAMLCLIAALGGVWACMRWPDNGSLPLACGVLWLGGLGFGAVLNMLGKILPFLCWLHLKARNPPRGSLPSTHGFLSERALARIGGLHRLWLVCALVWSLAPQRGGIALALATLLLAGCLARDAWHMAVRYRAVRARCP